MKRGGSDAGAKVFDTGTAAGIGVSLLIPGGNADGNPVMGAPPPGTAKPNAEAAGAAAGAAAVLNPNPDDDEGSGAVAAKPNAAAGVGAGAAEKPNPDAGSAAGTVAGTGSKVAAGRAVNAYAGAGVAAGTGAVGAEVRDKPPNISDGGGGGGAADTGVDVLRPPKISKLDAGAAEGADAGAGTGEYSTEAGAAAESPPKASSVAAIDCAAAGVTAAGTEGSTDEMLPLSPIPGVGFSSSISPSPPVSMDERTVSRADTPRDEAMGGCIAPREAVATPPPVPPATRANAACSFAISPAYTSPSAACFAASSANSSPFTRA